MLNARNENKSAVTFSFPQTKLKNVFCIQCKRHFFLRDILSLNGLIPLLLECGHVICEPCTKSNLEKLCPLCNVDKKRNVDKKALLPLNLYALGVVVASHSRPVRTDDADISFSQPASLKLRQQYSQGRCHECGNRATVRCVQCSVLYCFACYSKIHGRALQSHSKVMLADDNSDGLFRVGNRCSKTCCEPVGYYCKTCQTAGCSHCLLRLHQKHECMPLEEKNLELLPNFYQAYDSVAESLQRVHQAQKKLKSVMVLPSKLQNSENVEASITQHFAHLHGVLQNMEKNMIDKLYQQRSYLKENLDEIGLQLRKQEDQLQTALLLASTVKDSLDTTDISEVTRKLEELADIPCHLVQEPVPEDQKVTFDVDKTIIAALEKHCTIQVPSISGFSLLRRELLPDDYEVEPLADENSIRRFLDKPATSIKSPPPPMPVSRQRSENNVMVEGSTDMVCISHVVDPACFYVQKVSCQNKLNELAKGMNALYSKPGNMPTEIALNKLYVVFCACNNTWRRGRVVDTKIGPSGEQSYDVFYADYGVTEENIPPSRIRNVTLGFAMLPVMAIRCSLSEIVPKDGKWHPNATEILTKLQSGDTATFIHIQSIYGDTYYVDLYTISQSGAYTSIKDKLTFLKYGNLITPHKLRRMNPESVRKYFKEQLTLEAYTEVQVQFVESPHCIYIQKAGENTACIYRMMQQMTADYEQNMSSSGYVYEPERGLPCAARGVDGFWYRGIISDVPTENTVKVFYVDLGYTLVVKRETIRALSAKYMVYRCQSIRISLRNVKPLPEDNGQWDQSAAEFIKEFLKDKETVKVIPYDKTNDTYNVFLYDHDANLSLLLVKEGLAQAAGSSSRDPPPNEKQKKRRKKKFPKVDLIATKKYQDESIRSVADLSSSKEDQDPFKIQVLIHQVESPDCIYVASASCEQPMMEMIAEMQEFYNTYHSEKRETWCKDMVCAVYSAKDKRYCRSKILEVKSAKEVLVFFYDMGIVETVGLKDIQPLHRKFSEISAYLFKVKLAGILPCGGSAAWPSLSVQKLREIVMEKQSCKFYISKIEDIEDSAIPVELWIKETKMDGPLAPTRIEINSVNRMLVEDGVALPIKDYAQSRDKILAIELRRQLTKRLKAGSRNKTNTKWYKIDNQLDDNVLIEDVGQNTSSDSESREESSESVPLPPKLSAWIPPASILEDWFIGVPTYLDHDGFLYLHSKERNAATLRYIEEELEKFYKNRKIRSYDCEWKTGDMCIAQYHANKKWYRGMVRKVLEDDTIEVEFVDYGNVEECAIGTIKKNVILGHIPIQCTKCIVYGLTPDNEDKKWKTSELDMIHHLIVEQECEISILDRSIQYPIISLVVLPNNRHRTKADLISLLVEEYGINVRDNFSVSTESESSASPLSESKSSAAESADVIIEKYIEGPKDNPAAACPESETPENISMHDDSIVLGHSVLFRQASVASDNEEKGSTDIENISWQNIKDKIVSSTPQGTSEENLSLNYKSMKLPKDTDFLEIELCCSLSATKFYAQIKENEHLKDLNAFYVLYERIMKDLQENASKQPKIKSIVPQAPCCAKFSDGIWYRCLIVEAETVDDTDDIEIKLLYVDFGNDEYTIVNSKEHEFHSLKEEWFDLPTMVIKCQLWNVEIAPDINYDRLLPELQKLYDKSLMAKVKEQGEEFINVELYEDKESDKTVYSSLIEDGLFQIKAAKEG